MISAIKNSIDLGIESAVIAASVLDFVPANKPAKLNQARIN